MAGTGREGGSTTLRISFRTKVLAVVLFAVMVPVLAMGIYLLDKSEGILRDKARETLSLQLLRRTAQVDGWMSDRLRELGRWSTSFVAFEGVAALTGTPTNAERTRRDLTEFLRSLQRYNHDYESLVIVDRKGTTLASTGADPLDERARALIPDGVPAHGVLSSVFASPPGRPTLLGIQPIQDNAARTLGYLVGRIELSDLQGLLASPPSERSLAFWLLDKEGHFVARAGRIVSASGPELFPFALSAGSSPGQASTIGTREMPGLTGPTIYTIRPLEGPARGYVVATLPSAVAYGSLEESRSRLLAYGVPLLVFVFGLTYVMARQVLSPVKRLSEGALRMSAGDLNVTLPVRGHDEIAELTRVFNEMAQRVREGLQRVEEARDALARSNEELTGANKALGRLAITDGLTGLYNHRHFHDTLQRELQLAAREERCLTLLMCDLDRFKAYNDRWGHSAGDRALRAVAHTARATIRTSDLAFRYGGEELTVLLPGCDKAQGLAVAEKICLAVRELPAPADQPGSTTTLSIGVATYPEDATEAQALLDAADAAMYAAKWRGRDCVVGSSPSSTMSDVVSGS